MNDNEAELLNIKQAASLLKVSEISLRRWTDAGKLPCFRVGGRRERRFRQVDLLAFLEDQTDTTRSVSPNKRGSTHILLEDMAIEYGKHLCSLYETDQGRVKLAVPFLAEGLRNGDMCFLIAASNEKTAILEQLGQVHDGLDQLIKDEKLIVCEGKQSVADMLDYLEQYFLMATRSGSRCLRVLGDMTWFLYQGLDIDDLFEFESTYNQTLAHRYPVVSLCQYDARKFSGTSIVNALKTHEDTFQYPLARFVGA